MTTEGPPPQYYPPQQGYEAEPGPYDQKGYPPQGGQAYGYPMQGQPGTVYQQPVTVVVSPAVPNPPPDHMVFNIMMTIFCCWPIGIFAILKSMACRDAINRGDRTLAEQLSREARRLGYWALGIGIAFISFSIIILVVIYAVILIPAWTNSY